MLIQALHTYMYIHTCTHVPHRDTFIMACSEVEDRALATRHQAGPDLPPVYTAGKRPDGSGKHRPAQPLLEGSPMEPAVLAAATPNPEPCPRPISASPRQRLQARASVGPFYTSLLGIRGIEI